MQFCTTSRASNFNAEFELYEFRRTATGRMPDVMVKIEAGGIYLCDNGGGLAIVQDIQAAFVAIGLQAELREL